MAILGDAYIYSQYRQPNCCASQSITFSSTQGGQTTTAPVGAPEVALLFYNFQLNGTTGSLNVVLQNIGNSSTSVSNVYFDASPFDNSFVTLGKGCAVFDIGHECEITLAFGPESLLPPVPGSAHSFAVEISGGVQFEYRVTAGMAGANCGLAHC